MRGQALATAQDRLRTGARRGAIIGLVVGLGLAVIGEAGSALLLNAAPYGDVAILGFSTVYGLPSAVAVGAVLGWRGRPARSGLIALAAAVPAGLIAVAQIVFQALSI